MHDPRRTWSAALVSALLVAASAAAGEASLEIEARRLLDEKRAADAVRLIETRSPAESREADVWFLLADGYHTLMDEAGMMTKRGLAKKMRRALEAALDIDPAHVDARRELADFYFYAPWIVGGDKKEAARQLDRLEQVAPGEAWATRGEHARNDGDLDGAREHFRRAVELGPRKPGLLVGLAVVEQQLSGYEESVPLLEEILAEDPDHDRANYYRARAAAMTGQDLERGLECARRFIEDCAECDDDDRGYGWWRRATILKRQGETEAAVAAYREALRLNPELKGARKALKELEG